MRLFFCLGSVCLWVTLQRWGAGMGLARVSPDLQRGPEVETGTRDRRCGAFPSHGQSHQAEQGRRLPGARLLSRGVPRTHPPGPGRAAVGAAATGPPGGGRRPPVPAARRRRRPPQSRAARAAARPPGRRAARRAARARRHGRRRPSRSPTAPR